MNFAIMSKGLHFVRILVLLVLSVCATNIARCQITGIKINGDTCTSLTLDLQATGTSSSPYFFWNFGDPASGTNDTVTITGASTSPFPTHTFSGPGVYTVCVSFQEPGSAVTTVCRTITVGLCCNGIIRSSDSCFNNNAAFSIETAASITSVLWNFGDPLSGAANTSTTLSPSHLFSAVGAYTVTAFVTAVCDTFTISYPFTVVNCGASCSGTIQMRDSCFQKPAIFSLNTTATVLSCTWSFGDPSTGSANTSTAINPSHVFSAPGSYNVTVSVVASCGTFTTSFTSVVTECLPPCQATIIADDGCSGRGTTFRISSNSTITSVTWNFGDPTSGTNNTSVLSAASHTYNNSGSYLVTANVGMSCGSVTVTKTINIVTCAEELAGCATILPTGFTPNGDGQNDIFFVRSEDLRKINVFRIYNRWGQLMYEKTDVLPNDVAAGWDGSFGGQNCAPDIYMYFVEGTCVSGKSTTLKGDVMIVR